MVVDPVFPEVSVAITVIRFGPAKSHVRIFDHVMAPKVAGLPLTMTLAIHPESDIVPVRVGIPVIFALFTWEVIAMRGAVVSGFAMIVTTRDTLRDLFPAVSVFQY
jgi:hypothetical protein